jgi:hypothetical protein
MVAGRWWWWWWWWWCMVVVVVEVHVRHISFIFHLLKHTRKRAQHQHS